MKLNYFLSGILLFLFFSSRIEDTTFIIAGIPVCIDAFRQIYGISKSKFYQVYQMYKNGYKVISPKKKIGAYQVTTEDKHCCRMDEGLFQKNWRKDAK